MADPPKLLYIVVIGDDLGNGKRDMSFRYTRPVLQSTLQLMGCKARHAFKISRRVFEVMRTQCVDGALPSTQMDMVYRSMDGQSTKNTQNDLDSMVQEKDKLNNSMPFELYKRRTTVVVSRDAFLDVVCDALSVYKYLGPNQRADLVLACRIRERRESITILLCGTSGCGKSTLSALLGSRLGITTVISTDSIRHMMRSFVDQKENPLLWASTYHAGEFLDPVAVAEAKTKRKAKKLSGIARSFSKEEISNGWASDQKSKAGPADTGLNTELKIGPKQMAIDGFKAQSEMVIESLDRLITAWEERKESVVVEGVHLSLNFVMGLMKKHPSIIPFMVYITNEDKHMERFAVRAKYMTLDPAKNKYVKYIRNIRIIQEYLCNRADKHLVPKVNNTNVDRSVAAIHATVFSSLRRREAGEQLYDQVTNTVALIDEEYRNQCAANSLSSKRMFQLIQRQGSSRHLMALVNTDGSVAKAWPVESVDENGKPFMNPGSEKGLHGPMYGPLQIGKAEPVNLQFGNFGISAWPSDTGGTSHAGSVDESKGDGTETGSRNISSSCSSPRMSDGPAKELKEELSVSGSEEEADDSAAEVDSDEDSTNTRSKENHDEMEGSVDEESTKSDDEYDDLAMQDGQENGYWSDGEEEYAKKSLMGCGNDPNSRRMADKYNQNLKRFLNSSDQLDHVTKPLRTPSSLLSERKQRFRKRSLSDVRLRGRSQSIPALGKHSSFNGAILTGAPKGSQDAY